MENLILRITAERGDAILFERQIKLKTDKYGNGDIMVTPPDFEMCDLIDDLEDTINDKN